MSFTGINSIIYSKITNDIGVKITDLDGLNTYRTSVNIHFMKTEERKEKDKYPFVSFTYLYGFTSFNSEDYNIPNLGYLYNKDEFIDFWSNVSKYTTPFYFVHSPHDNTIKTLFDVVLDGDEYIYMVHCNNGKVTIKKYIIQQSSVVDGE